MKKWENGILFLLLAAVLLLLSGCGKKEEEGAQDLSDMATFMSGGVDIEHFGSDEWSGGSAGLEGASGTAAESKDVGSQAGQNPPSAPVALSQERKKIVYAGEPFMKTCACVGADGIYFTAYHGVYTDRKPAPEDYFWGRMEKEDDQIQEFMPDIPADLFAMRGCVDAQGNWHVLCVRNEDGAYTYEEAEIIILDKQGNKIGSVDYMEALATKKFVPFWMAVDEEGNYFLANNGILMQLDSAGHVKKWYGTEPVEVTGMGIGRSGKIYVSFLDETGEECLGYLETETGVIEQCASFGKRLTASFSVLQPGVHTELLLANSAEGVWRYDGEKLEQLMETVEIFRIGREIGAGEQDEGGACGSSQDIGAMGFLNDGRVCVMTYEEETHKFYYVPVEE